MWWGIAEVELPTMTPDIKLIWLVLAKLFFSFSFDWALFFQLIWFLSGKAVFDRFFNRKSIVLRRRHIYVQKPDVLRRHALVGSCSFYSTILSRDRFHDFPVLAKNAPETSRLTSMAKRIAVEEFSLFAGWQSFESNFIRGFGRIFWSLRQLDSMRQRAPQEIIRSGYWETETCSEAVLAKWIFLL